MQKKIQLHVAYEVKQIPAIIARTIIKRCLVLNINEFIDNRRRRIVFIYD